MHRPSLRGFVSATRLSHREQARGRGRQSKIDQSIARSIDRPDDPRRGHRQDLAAAIAVPIAVASPSLAVAGYTQPGPAPSPLERTTNMPRANRNFLPGHIWHITNRCHKKEFLLRFRIDKRAWIDWALEAKARFGLAILNFMITSNHIHLLAMARASHWACRSVDALSRALQLIESRVAQNYNMRKGRHGAFWGDRYHATAIEDGPQLATCLTYIDMNMTRAGVVAHPRDWPWCGYRELEREAARLSGAAAGAIRTPAKRRRSGFLVDTNELMEILGVPDVAALLARRSEWIDVALRRGHLARDPVWTESLAVGSESFLSRFQAGMGSRVGVAVIEPGGPDGGLLCLKKTRGNPIFVLGAKNTELSSEMAQNRDLTY
jgi:putative transposase